jgi:hypothetical protein
MLRPAWLVALIAVCVLAPAAMARASRAPLTWAAPVTIDTQQPAMTHAFLQDVTCPTTGLCAGVDDRGNVVTTTDPTAPAPTWASQAIAPGKGLTAIACSTTALCVAVGAGGTAAVTLDPTATSPTWITTTLPGGDIATAACPTSTTCLAIAGQGAVFSLTVPRSGTPTWQPDGSIRAPTLGIAALACAPDSLCVAVDNGGDTFTSVEPVAPDPRWRTDHRALGKQPFNADHTPEAISCPSASLCLTAGSAPFGKARISHDPGAAKPTWTVVKGEDAGNIESVSCASTTRCIAIIGLSTPIVVNPSAPGVRFSRVRAAGGELLEPEVGACAGDSACVAVGGQSAEFDTEPPRALPRWSSASVADPDGLDSLSGISCPSADDCLAVDDSGNVFITDQARAATPAWRLLPQVIGTRIALECQEGGGDPCIALQGVTCPSTRLCVAVSGSNDVELSVTDPFSAHPRASIHGRPGLSGDFTSVSCRFSTLCVAVDDGGDGAITTEPAARHGHWTGFDTGIDDGQEPDEEVQIGLNGVSCPTTQLCVAVDDTGQELVTTHPKQPSRRWHRFLICDSLDGCGPGLAAVTCPSVRLCIAVDDSGQVLTTTAPAATRPHWRRQEIDFATGPGLGANALAARLASVTCPSARRCVVVEADGREFESTDPAAVHPTWTSPRLIDPGVPLRGVSCPSVNHCIAVDDIGRTLQGSVATAAARP